MDRSLYRRTKGSAAFEIFNFVLQATMKRLLLVLALCYIVAAGKGNISNYINVFVKFQTEV